MRNNAHGRYRGLDKTRPRTGKVASGGFILLGEIMAGSKDDMIEPDSERTGGRRKNQVRIMQADIGDFRVLAYHDLRAGTAGLINQPEELVAEVLSQQEAGVNWRLSRSSGSRP